MAFSFSNSGNAGAAAGGAGGQINQGADLQVIQTEGLGFLSIAGDAKIRLTPTWSPPPAPTAHLLSIASRKGLVAAAGPDGIYIASTESVRKAFEAKKTGDSEVRPFEPQAKVALPMRVSQLYFTADEKYLILSAESGGGLAVYEVEALANGSSQAVFELNTNGESVRQLVPNPMPESATFCAVVTGNGNLMMANLQERQFVTGSNGQSLLSLVTSAAWSTKGKQLVAGLSDGTIHQLTPDGTEKAIIPKPPTLGDYHVSSVTWLENHVFLAVHTPTNGQDSAVYHLITRQQQPGASAPPPSFTFQKLTDPVEPYVADKVPHHTILRLHQFPPNLDELLLVASTAVESIGMLTKSKTPLTVDEPAEGITNVFTTTELADDSKRAQLPMGEDMSDTYPIGVALDLSSKEKVYKPIPTDEIEESPVPVPGLWALNNEGVLSIWWVVYNESIRSGTTYPGLVAVAEPAVAQATSQGGFASSGTPTSAAFGTSSTTTPSAFGAAAAPTSTPAFGTPSGTPAGFGTPAAAKPNPFASSTSSSAFGAGTTAAPAFGGPPALGAKPNPWATQAKPATPTFGQSTFGSSNAASETPKQPKFGEAGFGFGQSASLGVKSNPWATGSTSTAQPAFGQSGFGAASGTAPPSNKVFGASTSTPAAGGGFSAFANKGGFGSATTTGTPAFSSFGQPSGGAAPSIFGKPSGDAAPSIFGKPSGAAAPPTTEISMDGDTAFPPPTTKPASGSTFGSSPFVLGSTFQRDPKTADDNEPAKPEGSGGALSGGMFGSSGLGDLLKPTDAKSKEAATTTPTTEKPKSIFEMSTTPTTTPAPSKLSNVFGTSAPPPAAFANPFAPKPKAPGAPETEEDESSEDEFSDEEEEFQRIREISDDENDDTDAEKVKSEEDTEEDKENFAKIPQAPLPPDTTSTATPSRDAAEDAPLPPDFLSKAPQPKAEDAPLPPDFLSAKKTPANLPEAAPLPSDFLSIKSKPDSEAKEEEPQSPDEAPLPPNFLASKKSGQSLTTLPEVPDDVEDDDLSGSEEGELFEDEEGDENEEEDDEDDEEHEEEEATEEGTEGSGVDVSKDLSPDVTIENTFDLGGRTPSYTPQGSFTGMTGSTFSSFPKVEQPARPLFGEITRNAPRFGAMGKAAPATPRSPSPGRRPGAIPPHLSRPENSRSVSAPGMASQILGKGNAPAQGLQSLQPAGKASFMLDPNVEEQRRKAEKERKEEEDAQKLIDPEEEGTRQILESKIEPTLRLDAFVAAETELPPLDQRENDSMAAQCETLWRDLNRMIHLVGLNGRSLQAFIEGHSSMFKQGGRTKEDLEHPDDWVLVEAEELGSLVEGELTRELEENRVRDVEKHNEAIRAMTRELARLRAKQEDMHKLIMSYVDPDQVAITKSLPLSAEQAAQRNEIRRAYANVIKLLADAEESLTMLRTKIVSAGGPTRKTGAPTVDAVIRTINKLTTMAEKRSGDVDVLEQQMRRLRMGTPGADTPRPGSREGSPFVTGTPSKTPLRKSVLMSPGNFRDSFSSSVGARGASPRKKMSMYTEEERKAVLTKQQKRKAKLGMLRDALERAGPNHSTLDDE